MVFLIQLGIRLHDVHAASPKSFQTLEDRADTAREEGFSCVHLALGKVQPDLSLDAAALTEGFAMHVRHVFERRDLDIAVLGCYLQLADPDPDKRERAHALYRAHLRTARLFGAGVVGTETGPLGPEGLTKKRLQHFLHCLEPLVTCAQQHGAILAIEPVRLHTVRDTDTALTVLRSIRSDNLRLIFDPVNLLAPDNVAQRDYVLQDAMERLCDAISVVHLKDL